MADTTQSNLVDLTQFNTVKQSELYLDVVLNVDVQDFTGKKTYTVKFFREGIGFGITNINIEMNASMQPIVEIEFKDLYGSTVFGKYYNKEGLSNEIDHSVLFAWPPPKFQLIFKGYLGHPNAWILNVKKIDTSYHPEDGSFIFKVTFVPNIWGFLADLPVLYLYAVRKLKLDEKADPNKIVSVFDFIEAAQDVEKKKSDIGHKYDPLLDAFRSLLRSGINGAILEDYDKYYKGGSGQLFTTSGIDGFKDFIVRLPADYKDAKFNNLKDSNKQAVIINKLQAITGNKAEINRIKAWSAPSLSQKTDTDINALIPIGNTEKINSYAQETTDCIKNNYNLIKAFEEGTLFKTATEKVLRQLTISTVFSTLAGNAAYIMGKILEAGIYGYQTHKEERDKTDNGGQLIGKYFPLKITNDTERKEIPADDTNIGINDENCEMDFVNKFIKAICIGYADAKQKIDATSDQALPDLEGGNLNVGTLIQRINNAEILQTSPYVNITMPQDLMYEIINRSGIFAWVTDSYDSNNPNKQHGIYSSIEDTDLNNIVDNELKNIPESTLQSFNEPYLEELKTYLTVFENLFSNDGKYFSDINGNNDLQISETLNKDLSNYLVLTKLPKKISSTYFTNGDYQKNLQGFINKDKNIGTAYSEIQANFPNDILDVQVQSITALFNTIGWNDVAPQETLIDNSIVYTQGLTPGEAEGLAAQYFIMFTNKAEIDILSKIATNNPQSDGVAINNTDINKGIIILSQDTALNKDGTVINNDRKINIVILDQALSVDKVFDYNKMKTVLDNKSVASVYTDYTKYLSDKKSITKEDIAQSPVAYVVYNFASVWSWNLFGQALYNQSNSQRMFVKLLCKKLKDRISGISSQKEEIFSTFFNKAQSYEELIYNQMHHLFYQWKYLLSSDEFNLSNIDNMAESEAKKISTLLEGVYGERTGGIFRYAFPLQLITGERITTVEDSIINIEALNKCRDNANTSCLNVIQQLCTQNNFTFFPMPGRFSNVRDNKKDITDYGKKDIEDMFTPQPMDDKIFPGNFFQLLFLPTTEDRQQIKENFSNNNDQKNVNAAGFKIKFGDPGNKIVKSVNVSTDFTKPTVESIINIQNLSDPKNQNRDVITDCSLLPVYQGRSYKALLDMLGNAQLSPMMFFYIENMPIFEGLYQIMKVSHSITPNDMGTHIEGIKMRCCVGGYGAIHPVTLESLREAGVSISNVQETNVGDNSTFISNFNDVANQYGSVIYKKTWPSTPYIPTGPPPYVGVTFKTAYDIQTNSDGSQTTIITNPFYWTVKHRDINNTPPDGNDGIINKNIIALQENLLSVIYNQFKEGLTINSGFRSNALNAALYKGKDVFSWHKKGQAADIVFVSSSSSKLIQVYNWLVDNWGSYGLGVGLPLQEVILEHKNGFWLHISITPYPYKYNKSITPFKISDMGRPKGQQYHKQKNPPKKIALDYNGIFPGKFLDGTEFTNN